MKNKKFLILFLIFWVAVATTVIVISQVKKNIIKYYNTDINIDSYGNIEVSELVVIKYGRYDNYLLRDIKYGKFDYTEAPYNQYSYSNYTTDIADFEESTVDVTVYRGNLIDDPNEVEDITEEIDIGYSWNGDRYKTESGTYDVECEAGSRNCECISVDAIDAGTLIGEMTFLYRYTIYGMVTKFDDCAELNYKLFEYLNMKVQKAEVNFYFSKAITTPDEFHCYGHGLSQGNVIAPSANDNKVTYTAKNIAKTDEFECRIIFPSSYVSNISANNTVNVDLLNPLIEYETALAKETNTQIIIVLVANIITIIIIGLMIIITIKMYKKYDKEFTPSFDKEYLRELPFDYPPAIMSYLYYFGKNNDEDVTATLLDLIRRGYLDLETSGDLNAKDPNFTIRFVDSKKEEMKEVLLPHEKHLITWFISHIGDGEKVTIEQIEDYGKKYSQAQVFQNDGLEFQKKIKSASDKHDFFLNTMKDKKEAAEFGFIPLIFGLVLFILSKVLFAFLEWNISLTWNTVVMAIIAVVYFVYVATIKKRSVNGNEEYAQWGAFKRFLEDFGNFKDYAMPGILIWEHFLVYATSFKIADKVMEQLKVKLPDLSSEGTFMSNRYYYHHNFYVHSTFNRINSSISKARVNTFSSIAAHNSSSGGGHGGGFSGGSSHGGGGGGFRGGR